MIQSFKYRDNTVCLITKSYNKGLVYINNNTYDVHSSDIRLLKSFAITRIDQELDGNIHNNSYKFLLDV